MLKKNYFTNCLLANQQNDFTRSRSRSCAALIVLYRQTTLLRRKANPKHFPRAWIFLCHHRTNRRKHHAIVSSTKNLHPKTGRSQYDKNEKTRSASQIILPYLRKKHHRISPTKCCGNRNTRFAFSAKLERTKAQNKSCQKRKTRFAESAVQLVFLD